MKLGAETQKVALLSLLGLVLVYVVYTNLIAGPSDDPIPVKSGLPAAAPTKAPVAAKTQAPPSLGKKGRQAADFRPSLRPKPDEVRDLTTVDPSLQMELLAKLRTVTYTGAGRNLFEFAGGGPVAPTTPDPKIIPGAKPAAPKPQRAQAIYPMYQPPAPPPPKPRAPPINMKYYGFVSNSGRAVNRKGFFLDGDEIIVVGEGDVIKSRYKVLRIGLTSAEMQDTQFADDRQQLPLVEEPAGS
ncbi:MAG: hypothetical protein K2X03_17860 [Bryobacteraceae bacterium]|nr:hypothetical protein [Bryobacteraceae bacterium]